MKRVILEFIGGAWDGMNLCNDSPDPIEIELAVRTYFATDDGEIGETVIMPAGYALRRGSSAGCKYVVEDRTVVGDEVLIRLAACDEPVTADSALPAVRIVLQFEGGYLNGRSLDSQSADVHEALLALAYYHITNQGSVGEAFNGIPVTWRPSGIGTDAPQGVFRKDHEYRVVQRIEECHQIVVRFEYRPKETRAD
jgi:hypothetical protein